MSTLKKRLDNFWEEPDFDSFFVRHIQDKPRRVKKGNTLFYQGDVTNKLTYIKKGFVKLYQSTEDGREPVAYLYGPQTILGLRALTSKDHAYWHSAKALTDCELIFITADEYKEILSEYPENIIDLLYLFIQRLNYTERRLYGFITAETTARTAVFLYDCMIRFGVKKDRKILIPIPLTHQLIAEFIGSARESVTICLTKLVKEKIILNSRGGISILDEKKLKNLAKI